MTTPDTAAQPTPPYTAFTTFKNFLTTLKKTTIPPIIDTSMMGNMSGSAQGQIKQTLRFLGLTTLAGTVTPQLRALVGALGTDKWKETLTQTMTEAYKPVIQDLDIENATLGQLMECIKTRGGLNGSALRKATRFYLDAAKDAGIKLSPHFAVRGLGVLAGQSTKPSRARAAARAKEEQEDEDDEPGGRTLGAARDVPEGFEELLVPLPNRDPIVLHVPEDMTDAEWLFVQTFVTAYLKLRQQV
jgi:hypothetical protein